MHYSGPGLPVNSPQFRVSRFRRSGRWVLGWCLGGLVLAVLVRLLVPWEGLTSEILALRAQRVGIGVVVGGVLALGGVLMQHLMRNPLASPDFLGMAAGGGLAVSLGIAMLGGGLAWPVQAMCALAGALAALSMVYMLSRRQGGVDPGVLILVGVVIGLMCAAGTMLVQHLSSDRGESSRRWLLGAIDENTPWAAVFAAASVLVVGIAWTWQRGELLDAAVLGDDEARSMGVDLGGIRRFEFVMTGLLAAGAVVLAGPVGFVGLIGSHMARGLGGPHHRTLAWSAPLAGAAVVLLSDGISRWLATSGGRLPLGVVTSVLGGITLVVIVRRGIWTGRAP
jgi:iron complex transport system permease protein